jgi:hypothetical protein
MWTRDAKAGGLSVDNNPGGHETSQLQSVRNFNVWHQITVVAHAQNNSLEETIASASCVDCRETESAELTRQLIIDLIHHSADQVD